MGVGIAATTPTWPRLKRRFSASAVSAERPADVGRSGDAPTDPTNGASGSGSTRQLELGTATRKEVILVTGGAGFLGQHVVRLLQERAKNVEEIRVFDMRPYRNRLGKYTEWPKNTANGCRSVLSGNKKVPVYARL